MFVRSRRLAAALAAVIVVLAVLGVTAPPSHAAVDPAVAALDWLEGELATDGGHLTTAYEYQGSVYSYDDWGLTIDAVLALAAGGRATGTAATTAAGLVEDNVDAYVTGGEWAPDDRYSAPLGKALLMAEVMGADPTSFGGLDLVAELTARLQTTGADAGRFTDLSGYGDFSNGLGQALAIMGLARTADGAPASAVDFLLAQQCPGGGFRGDYTDPGGCTADDEATVDATGFAVAALTAVSVDCEVRAAVTDAVGWLSSVQDASGGFGGESGTNTNSTGLAASALRALGATGAADAGAAFVTSLQLTDGDDLGAIARNADGFAGAADGVGELERDGFRRATAQAVLAFDVPAYSELGLDAIDPAAYVPCVATPIVPGTSPATATLSAGSVLPGGSLTITGHGFEPGEPVTATIYSTPVLLGTALADADGTVSLVVTIPALEAGLHRIELVGQHSGRTTSVEIEVRGVETTQTLPATGRGTGAAAALGAALVLGGTSLMAVARRRRVAHG